MISKLVDFVPHLSSHYLFLRAHANIAIVSRAEKGGCVSLRQYTDLVTVNLSTVNQHDDDDDDDDDDESRSIDVL